MYTVTCTSKDGGHCQFSHPNSNVVFEFISVLTAGKNSNWLVIKATGPDGKEIKGT